MTHDENMAALGRLGLGLVIRPGQSARYFAYAAGTRGRQLRWGYGKSDWFELGD